MNSHPMSPRPTQAEAERALKWAVHAASRSRCAKSQRGVVIWLPGDRHPLSDGTNHQPSPHKCDGSDACRSNCAKLCVHAEADALVNMPDFEFLARDHGFHMLHVKVVDGRPVPSGPPSCWQCSRLILDTKAISTMWLLHAEGLRSYSTAEFHRLTLEHNHLPVLTEGPTHIRCPFCGEAGGPGLCNSCQALSEMDGS